jgi:hypothetical protein
MTFIRLNLKSVTVAFVLASVMTVVRTSTAVVTAHARADLVSQSASTGADRPVPRFDVVSVKRCEFDGGERGPGGQTTPNQVTVNCARLTQVIQQAYIIFRDGVTRNRLQAVMATKIEGMPDWGRSDFFASWRSPRMRRRRCGGPLVHRDGAARAFAFSGGLI